MPVIAVMVVATWFLLKRHGGGYRFIPFIVLAGLILLGESIKQIGAFVYSENGYPLFWLPLHISSVPIYTLPLSLIFYKKPKWSRVFWSLAFSSGVIISALTVFYPTLIFGDEVSALWQGQASGYGMYIGLYSVVLHLSYLYYVALIFLLKPSRWIIKEIFIGMSIFAIFVVVAIFMSNTLDTNFMGMREAAIGFLKPIFDVSVYLYQIVLGIIYLLAISIVSFACFKLFKYDGIENDATYKGKKIEMYGG